ncbi:MAG: ABC transporter permease [Clostridia bacterium]|nr:ABC transporter permease [Clostridia bacterium]
MDTVKKFLFDNKVIVLFVVLCLICLLIADTTLNYVASEVLSRFGRNTCLVLALIIPCLAGLGMNFGIVVGAIAAQISIFWIVHWGFTGITGFLLCVLMSTPLAIFFGYLLGKLFNNTKGAEMIAGLVLGFFADGLYRLFVLYIMGGVIPYDDPNLLDRGFGLRNAFDLTGNLKYALDDISFLTVMALLFGVMILSVLITSLFKAKKGQEVDKKQCLTRLLLAAAGLVVSIVLRFIPFFNTMLGGPRLKMMDALMLVGITGVVWAVYKMAARKDQPHTKTFVILALSVIAIVLKFIPPVANQFVFVQLSSSSYAVICLICFFNNWILNTKLGQDMRTVGQNRSVATSAGINVNRIRIIATCISTVLAAWGQLIFLQNLGTFNTVQQQTNVGLYAVAAILVGGANVQKATNKQAIIGVFLFHTMFVLAPLAATRIVGDSAISEYIRMFFSYGVIAVSLAMHAWKKAVRPKKEDAEKSDK